MKLSHSKVRGTKHLLGTDGIVYGDKVINVRNQKIKGYHVKSKKNVEGYVANGEVGIVERIWETPKARYNTSDRIFFSTGNEL